MNSDLVKGFQDFTGEEAVKRTEVRRIIEDAFSNCGFEPVETPVIENEEFVRGNNISDEAVSDIFRLEDRGKRKLALRYEFTFQLKRIAQNKKLPYKRYQIGPVFRDEPTSENRFRQFTQCDADIIGSNIKDEAELMSIIKEVFDKLNIKFTIYVNNRKLLNEILDEQKISDKERVIKEIDKLDKLSENEIKNNLKKYNAEKVLAIFKKPESYFKKYNSYKDIQELQKYCKIYGVKIEFLPSLARGLSYYNGSIFEVKVKDKDKMKETICAGGSYLVNNYQSSGISFGIERISKIAKVEIKNKPLLIISLNQDKEAINLAKKLREESISCIVYYGKPTKGLEFANSNQLKYVLFFGEDEKKSGKYKIKSLLDGKEKLLSYKSLVFSLK